MNARDMVAELFARPPPTPGSGLYGASTGRMFRYALAPSAVLVGLLACPTFANADGIFVSGRLFIADSNVKVYEPDGTLVTSLDDPTAGQFGDVAFNYVRDLLYVADRQSGKLFVFDQSGATVQIIGPAPGETLAWGTSIDSAGTAYVVGSGNRVHVFANDGSYLRTILTPYACCGIQSALSADGTRLYVTENSTHSRGIHTWDVGNNDAYLGFLGNTLFTIPNGVATSPDGTIYVGDGGFGGPTGALIKMDANGQILGTIASSLNAPLGIAVDHANQVWVTETNRFVIGQDKVLGFDENGVPVGSLAPYPEVGQPVGMEFYNPPLPPLPRPKYRLTDLGPSGFGISRGKKLSASGQATGEVFSPVGAPRHAFQWNGTAMQDLGTLPGHGQSEAIDINASGQVLGQSYAPLNVSVRAFLWNGSTMEDLGTLGGTSSSGFAINDAGQVTGNANTAGNAQTHAFLWSGGLMQDLGTLGGSASFGSAINASGQVAGSTFTSAGENHAFLWSSGVMQDLGTIGGTFSQAYAINDAGQVTGESRASDDGSAHAFLWDEGVMIDLGTLGGESSFGIAISDSGFVTGDAATTDGPSHAFLWNGSATLDLGTLGGTASAGRAINSTGWITGHSDTTGNADIHAFLWIDTAMLDLNGLIDLTDPLKPFVTLKFGVDINDSGQVLVDGVDSRTGLSHAYLAYIVTGDDNTPPLIQSNITGSLGNGGWYVSNVQVAWSVSDAESAISSSTGCGATSVTTDSAGVTYTCSATSEGGTSTESVTIKRDATGPTATASATPPANASGWRKTNVTVSFTGTDALSGGVTCDPQVLLSAQGAGQTASGRCYDAAGNQSALATASGINIDKTKPTASIVTPVNNATYNRNQVVTASYSCSDSLSGILTCMGTIANGQLIDTSKKVKNKKFTVDATDRAGNTQKATTTYSVN